METTQDLPKLKRGQQMVNAQRLIVIAKIVEQLTNGYMSTYALAKKLRVSKEVINTYRPLADKLIAEHSFDRNVIRNLQVNRTYNLIEQLMRDLKAAKTVKERSMIYGSIYKFSSHLALITGLNIETHVNIDPTKLVIIRAAQKKKADRITEHDEAIQIASETVDRAANSSDNS